MHPFKFDAPFFSRFPFNWKNPFGYIFAVIFEYIYVCLCGGFWCGLLWNRILFARCFDNNQKHQKRFEIHQWKCYVRSESIANVQSCQKFHSKSFNFRKVQWIPGIYLHVFLNHRISSLILDLSATFRAYTKYRLWFYSYGAWLQYAVLYYWFKWK